MKKFGRKTLRPVVASLRLSPTEHELITSAAKCSEEAFGTFARRALVAAALSYIETAAAGAEWGMKAVEDRGRA